MTPPTTKQWDDIATGKISANYANCLLGSASFHDQARYWFRDYRITEDYDSLKKARYCRDMARLTRKMAHAWRKLAPEVCRHA